MQNRILCYFLSAIFRVWSKAGEGEDVHLRNMKLKYRPNQISLIQKSKKEKETQHHLKSKNVQKIPKY